MKKGALVSLLLILTLCLGALGFALGKVSDSNAPMKVSTGYYQDGQFHTSSSGYIGGNKEAHESTSSGSTICYVLAGISGLGCLITLVVGKKNT